MKKQITLILTCLLIVTAIQVEAQKFYIRDIFDFYNDINAPGLSKETNVKSYSEIDGSPYLQKDFVPGSLITNEDHKYENIPMKYNGYDDRMEYKHKSGISFFLAKPEDFKEILLGGSTFIYEEFKLGRKKVQGYYEVLSDGKISLLKKYTIAYKEAEPQKPFSDPKPAKFVKKPNTYYIYKGEENIYEIKNEKECLAILQDQKNKLAKYIKSEKLKIKKEEDLKKLIEYYNTL